MIAFWELVPEPGRSRRRFLVVPLGLDLARPRISSAETPRASAKRNDHPGELVQRLVPSRNGRVLDANSRKTKLQIGTTKPSGTRRPRLKLYASESGSRGFAQLEHGEMREPRRMAHDQSKLPATPSPNRRLRSCAGSIARIARPRFESWAQVRGTTAREDLVRRAADQSLVGPVHVVPSGVAVAEHEHGAKRQRYKPSSWPEGFALERAPEALDASDGSVLADGPVAGLDAVPFAPSAVLVLELRAVVGDGVLRRAAGPAARPVQEAAGLLGGGLLDEDADGEHAAREVVEDDGEPEAEGPHGIMALGNHGTQKPRPVGTMEWSMPQTWLGWRATTVLPESCLVSDGAGTGVFGFGFGPSRSMRSTVLAARCRPQRARSWAIRVLPMAGHAALS